MSGRVYQEIDDMAVRWDYTSTASTWYQGHASPGAAEDDNVWRIKRLTLDGSNRLLKTEFADGDGNYNNVWSNRTSLDYS